MPRRQDIDRLLREWPYQPGEISARLIKAADGRQVLQLRIDLGLMQLEVNNRPDGERPGGAETYFDYLLALAIHAGEDFELTEEQCREVDREFVQYYQRRLCWLALREFDRVVCDADHTLNLMDFVREHSPSQQWTWSHEQYRPFVLFHRTQAAAFSALERLGAEPAIEAVSVGLERIREFFVEHDLVDQFEEDELVQRLLELRESVREHYRVGKTLSEQLAEAVASEQYELAAQLRDEIARRNGGH